jgi:uncharacterized protein YjbI with pentapeptide repeats
VAAKIIGWVRQRLLLSLGVLAVIAVIAIGSLLLRPLCAPPDRGSDLGTALVGGGVIAFAVLVLERQYAKRADKRDLQQMLGTGDNFVGIDLRGRDLRGSYLVGKDFSGAKFDGADLRGVNLSGADLSWASFIHADLRGAKFSATMLTPSEYLYPSETLAPGAVRPGGKPLTDATMQAIRIRDAKYDSATEWPANFDPTKGGAVLVEDKEWWRQFFHRSSN